MILWAILIATVSVYFDEKRKTAVETAVFPFDGPKIRWLDR